MKNSLCYTTVSGSRRHAEFDSIKHIRRPVMVGTTGKYYSIYVTGVVYMDTGETVEVAHLGLFAPNDHVMYRGKRYEFDNLDRLCMVVENENNLAALESL